MTDNREALRAQFEAWCVRRWAGDRDALTVSHDGGYIVGHVNFVWDAFQEAARLAVDLAAPSLQERATLNESDSLCNAEVAWACTDYDGHVGVGLTKEEAKERAGEYCDEFFPLYTMPGTMTREVRMAVMMAYGHLWHVNNEPMAPIPMRSSEAAAYAARKHLRDLLTKEERGEAINQVGFLIGRYDAREGMEDAGKVTSKPECTHEGAAPLAGAARPDEQQHQQSATVEPGVGHPASQSPAMSEKDMALMLRMADTLDAGITTGHDWSNTQDELDRLGAARLLRKAHAVIAGETK